MSKEKIIKYVRNNSFFKLSTSGFCKIKLEQRHSHWVLEFSNGNKTWIDEDEMFMLKKWGDVVLPKDSIGLIGPIL